MTPEQLKDYLKNWMNKAVMNGGFNAEQARAGLNALDALYEKTQPNEE